MEEKKVNVNPKEEADDSLLYVLTQYTMFYKNINIKYCRENIVLY